MIRLGMLTPSSNTVLEPVTASLLAGAPGITAHFSRFRVTEIALDGPATAQFDDSPILAAADLLSHARVDVIAWNGTSASWLGLDRDRRLIERIEAATGIAATTCVLGFFDLFRRLDIRRLGLVTPYTSDVQARIAEVYGKEGVVVAAERHLGLRDNFSFAEAGEDEVAAMIRAVAAEADAVAIVCTNMAGARVAAALEAELGLPVLDSVAVTLRAALVRIGADPGRIAGWGRVFS